MTDSNRFEDWDSDDFDCYKDDIRQYAMLHPIRELGEIVGYYGPDGEVIDMTITQE